MKVLAAMSGGVDSAVAAARAVDAGHDVTGVHLALSKNPQSYRSGARGCCSKEDAHDARRAADVLGIPFYVWDLSDRFAADVVDDFVAEYAAGRTPNPCLRCNEKIKFAAVLERGGRAGLRRRLHRSLRAAGAHRTDGVELHRAVDADKDQSYVLGVLTQDQLRAVAVPAGRLAQVRGPGRGRPARARGGGQAGQPRHLLHRRRRHRRLPGPAGSARGPATIVDPTGATVGEHDGTPPVHRRPAPRPAARDARPRTAGRATCWTSPR